MMKAKGNRNEKNLQNALHPYQ